MRYEIYDSTESSDTAISQRTTWYNQARTISSVQVTMNENDEYRIDRIDCSYTYDNKWSDSNATSDVGSTFSIALNQDNNQYNAIVRIYVTKLRHELTVEYKKNTSDAPEIKTASKFYQLIDVNCEEYFNSNFESNGTLKENADVTTIGNQTISRDVAGYRFNHAVMSADKKTLTFYYDQLFKVTYDANGGTGNLPTEAEYVAGDEVTVDSQGNLEKTDCTFAGWKKGDEVVNGTFTMPAQNVTLTAQWTKTDPPVVPSNLVKAKFFINLGGKDASKPDGTGTFTKGIEIKDAINLDVFNTNKANGSKYGNNGYIFNNNGVKTQYPSLLNKEPTFEQINEKIPADKKESMSVGKGTGREVVWYHVSSCGDGYHVDGYIKNVAITITYDPNGGSFGDGVTIVEGKHTEPGTTGTPHQIISDIPQKAGYTFTGWKLKGSDDIYQPNGSITPTGDVTLVAQWSSNTVTLTYHENFGEKHTYAISVDRDSTQTVQSYAELRRLYGVFGENTGFYFDKWTTQPTGEGSSYKEGKTISMTDSIDLYAQWKKARVSKVAYTINQHFINEKNQENTTLANSQYKSAKQGAVLDTLITKTLKENKKDSENNVYVYIADKTTFKVGTTKVESTVTLSSKDTVIDLYYYLDNWKDADNTTDEQGKDSETGGDGIPDCYQVLVNYKSGDLSKGKIADTARTQEVLTIRGNDKQPTNEGTVTASGSTATATDSRCYFSSWINDAKVETSTAGAILGKQTIKNAKGGDVYTFTANFDRSSGGGSGGSNRPKPPVVEIPDNVPTGLNGKDHYAYIIGYGNNDVRPQNNITRAEVATIFFRLLTDETREANMTKSNSYNDVKDGDWFCCAVSTLSKMGIIKGYEDGSFKPNDPISRAEFAAIAARFDPDGDKTPATFADVTSHWAKDEISIAANHGWIKGYEDGSFKPDQKITRAETMTLVNRVLNRLPEAKDDLHKDMKTWVDNMDETAWYYLAVQEATNSHYFKNKTGTKFEQWTDLRDTRDWSELEK